MLIPLSANAQCDTPPTIWPDAFVDTFPDNAQPLGFTPGNLLTLGATIIPAEGCEISNPSATLGDLEYKLTLIAPGPWCANCWYVSPMPLFDPMDHLGVWTISVEHTCGDVVNVCTSETHNFDKGDTLGVMPYLKDVRASGDPLAPTITWRPPETENIPDFCYGIGHPRPPHYKVRLLTASNDQFYRSDRFWDTEYTIPLGVLTVDDIPNTWVRIEHRCQDADYGLELRSETFRPLQDLYLLNKPTVIFSDNFDDGNDDGWNQFLGTWSAATGEYVTITAPFDSDFYTFTGNATWSNYIFEADVKMDMWLNDVGLVFYNQPGNTQNIRFTINKTGDNSVLPRITWFDGDIGGELATFTNTALSLVDDTWYHFKAEIVGNTVYAYIDGVLFALADGSPLPFSSGGIGLVSDQEDRITSFDNVLVTTNAVPEPASIAMPWIPLLLLDD
jgi:hypothetical protein